MRFSFLAISLTFFASGCAKHGADSEATAGLDASPDELHAPKAPRALNQGWSADDNDKFHFTDQGGELVPYTWFIALEQADSETLLTAPNVMRSLGLLVEGVTARNPDGLPLGLVRVDNSSGSWLSMTCAACHVGQFSFQGQAFRVEGGQGFTDLGGLLTVTSDSLAATVADDKKFNRFAGRVLGRGASADTAQALRQLVSDFNADFSAYAQQIKGPRTLGPGRADSTNAVLNSTNCRELDAPENCEDGLIPSNIPPLWLTDKLEWVQTNANQNVPVIRDMLQSAIFGKPHRNADGSVTSAINIANLRTIEGMIAKLNPPAWPEEILGRIDQTQATRGMALYAANCASCHSAAPYAMTAPNKYGKSFIQVAFTPAADIGTDAEFISRYLGRRSDAGVLQAAFTPEQIGPDGKVVAVQLTVLAFGPLLAAALAPLDPLSQLALLDAREPKTPTVAQLTSYKAGPLAGVALSGYFLHNGSVRTLHQLLLPPEQRETLFYVGSREYDPAQLGYVSDASVKGAYAFHTGAAGSVGVQRGDSNGGHAYGTTLSENERKDLLEYLKTL